MPGIVESMHVYICFFHLILKQEFKFSTISLFALSFIAQKKK